MVLFEEGDLLITPQAPVRYRAEDAVLVALYVDDEIRIELPGWGLEEVHSIVLRIEGGNWEHFHEVVALGGTPGVSVQGTLHGNSYGPVESLDTGVQVPPESEGSRVGI